MSYELFNYNRLSSMEVIADINDAIMGKVKIYKSTAKSYAVEYEDKDIIVTVSLKQVRFEAQRTYDGLKKITGAGTKEYRLFAQNTLYDYVDVTAIESTTPTKSTKKSSASNELLQFLASKYNFNIDDEKQAYEQSLKVDKQKELEEKIAEMQAMIEALKA